MSIEVLLLIVWVHWFADFVCQTDYMALNKSSDDQWLSFKALGLHVLVYSIFFIWLGVIFTIVNLLLHYAIDYFSSRAMKKAWIEEKRNKFFILLGFDQALHMTCLIGTYYLLVM